MKKIKFTSLLVAIMMALTMGISLAGTFATPVSAADEAQSSAMTVSPMNQRIVLTPGETYQSSIKVSNPASATQPLKYTASIGSFTQQQSEDGQDSTIDTASVTNYNQMMQWITLDKTSGEVAPNSVDVIPFTIRVPQDAPAGGQYATILVQNDTQTDSSTGNIMIQSNVQIASIIYAEVTGTTRQEAKILENNIPGFVLSNPLQATSLVENDGNVHTDASYTLQVWPMFSDEEICTNEEDPSQSLVMPETKQYHIETCDLGLVGMYRAKQTVKIFGEVSIVEHTVIICPIWLMLIILVIIFLIIFYFVKRAHDRHAKRI